MLGRIVTAHRVIEIHPLAPPKPATGAACNGCGVCCLAEPCPLGMLISRRHTGACSALLWDAGERLYRCGVINAPERFLPWLPRRWGSWLARRWVASGAGCDATIEIAPSGLPR